MDSPTAAAYAARITQIARVTAEFAAARDVETVTEILVTHAARALNARVAALVRMLFAKGRAGMLAEALAEFAAICML